MPRLFLIALLGVFALTLLVIGWRFLSRRHQLPCPAAFIWMLEHRIMESIAGAPVLMQRARIKPGMMVLDAGCGPGRVSITIAEYLGPQGMVVALDIQAAMLDRLRERAEARGIENITPLQSKLGEANLASEEFDRALMVTVLGEVPDREAALAEIHRALKPGGILSITEVLPDPHFQSRKTVRRLGVNAGFKIEVAYNNLRAFTMNLHKPDVAAQV